MCCVLYHDLRDVLWRILEQEQGKEKAGEAVRTVAVSCLRNVVTSGVSWKKSIAKKKQVRLCSSW
jgi:hypothetical protein